MEKIMSRRGKRYFEVKTTLGLGESFARVETLQSSGVEPSETLPPLTIMGA